MAWMVKSPRLIAENSQGSLHANEHAARGMYQSEIAKAKHGDVISMHHCSHAEGEPPERWYNCRRDPRAEYEETVKITGGPS